MSGSSFAPSVNPELPSPTEVDLLWGLVSISSPTGSEARAARWLAGRATNLGLRAHVDQVGNVLIEAEPSAQPALEGDIYLLGHLDTVPGNWSPSIEDGRLSGRGSSDAKGPLAAFVAATARALSSGRLRRRVLVLAALGEEGDSRGARWLSSNLPAPAYLVVGEPSGSDRVGIGYRGSLRCTVTIAAPPVHSSRPEPTVAERACSLWASIGAMVQSWDGSGTGFHALDVHLVGMRTSGDGLQQSAAMELAFRLPPGQDTAVLLARLAELDLSAKVELERAEPAVVVGRQGKLPAILSAAIREMGKPPGWRLSLATCDLNVVQPEWRCPAVVYGPGDPALDHTPWESILLADYGYSIAVLTRVLSSL